MKEIAAVPYSVVAMAVEEVQEEARSASPVVTPRRKRKISRRGVVPVSFRNEDCAMMR
jgi:hypothetical protein